MFEKASPQWKRRSRPMSHKLAQLARFRALVETSSQALALVSSEGIIRYANRAATAILGYALDDLLGANGLELVHAEDRGPARERFAESLAAPSRDFVTEVRCRHRDGSWRFLEATITNRLDDPAVAAVVVSYRDVTERKRAEEALRAGELKYRSLIENLEQSVFLKDQELRFVAANQRFCQSLGCGEADIVGKTDFDFYPRHLAEKYRRDDLVVLHQGRHLELEEQNLCGGKLRTVRVVKTPVRDGQGKTIGVLGIFWDVTEQRALEAQLRQWQKMEAIGQLAGGVAHDFNNLLTAILGNVSLVLMQLAADDPKRGLLQIAERAALRAAELTRQLLGFSRRSQLKPQPLHLGAALADTANLLRRTNPCIQLETQVAADLWLVHADPNQMNQVLMNLCINSRDAMPDGGRIVLGLENVTIDPEQAALQLEAEAGLFVRLSVSDTGHGIPDALQPHIFEPFFTTKPPGKGTGLGLAMVYGIVEQHRGWIEFHSQVGEGTRFEVYLPRYVPPEAALEAASQL